MNWLSEENCCGWSVYTCSPSFNAIKKSDTVQCPPFISDELLSQSLSRYGKLVSPIKKIPIGSANPLLKHVFSFRRFAYMIVKMMLNWTSRLNIGLMILIMLSMRQQGKLSGFFLQ